MILYSYPLQPERMREPQDTEQQEQDPDEWAQPLAARYGLFDHHGASECNHPCQVAHTDPEHDEHQGPTTTKAVSFMPYTQAPGWTHALAVVVYEEPEWRAAHVQAALLERTELEQAGDEERHRTDQPRMHCQPVPPGHEKMHQRVSKKGARGKRCPDCCIASQKREWNRDGTGLFAPSIHHQFDHGHT